MVDVEFFGEQKVQDAWADLLADYNRKDHPGLNNDQIFAQREEKFATLLFEIGQVVGYKFGRTYVRDNIYRPQLHADFDEIDLEKTAHIQQDCDPIQQK
jgi:hypothetical protein